MTKHWAEILTWRGLVNNHLFTFRQTCTFSDPKRTADTRSHPEGTRSVIESQRFLFPRHHREATFLLLWRWLVAVACCCCCCWDLELITNTAAGPLTSRSVTVESEGDSEVRAAVVCMRPEVFLLPSEAVVGWHLVCGLLLYRARLNLDSVTFFYLPCALVFCHEMQLRKWTISLVPLTTNQTVYLSFSWSVIGEKREYLPSDFILWTFPPHSLVLSVRTSKLEACVLPVFFSPRNVLPLLFPGAWRLLAREHFRFLFSIPAGRGCGGVHQGHVCSLTSCKQTDGRL